MPGGNLESVCASLAVGVDLWIVEGVGSDGAVGAGFEVGSEGGVGLDACRVVGVGTGVAEFAGGAVGKTITVAVGVGVAKGVGGTGDAVSPVPHADIKVTRPRIAT